MVNRVRPPFPASRPMARPKWSPFSGFTAKEYKYQQANQSINRSTERLPMYFVQTDRTTHRQNIPSVTSKDSMKRSSNRISAIASCNKKSIMKAEKYKQNGWKANENFPRNQSIDSTYSANTLNQSINWWAPLRRLTSTSNPITKALTKSAPFWSAPMSAVSGLGYSKMQTQLKSEKNQWDKCHRDPRRTRNSTLRLLRLNRICSFKCSTTGEKSLVHEFFNGVYRLAGTGILRTSVSPSWGETKNR